MLLNLIHLSPIALTEVSEGGTTVMWNLYSYLCTDLITDETTKLILLPIAVLLCIVSAYLIGSINPSIIFSKALYHDDIREHGSGNAGTTNMLRTYGKKMAVLIFAIDFFKAVLAIFIGAFFLSMSVGGAISALFVVLGHMFPIYYKFKGGKGVACTAACVLVLSPISFAILLPVFALIVIFTKYVSLASIITAMLFPLLANSFKGIWGDKSGGWITLSAIMIAALVVFMHRANIKRLLEGKESKTNLFKKKKSENEAEETKIKETAPQKEYTDKDFIKCSCGRIIPITRKECVYCGEKNPAYQPPENDKQNNKKKKK